jgi:serine phosphatase RsbU (regulator of sigma subunit)
MIRAAQQLPDATADDIVKAVFAAADAFVGGASQHDDMTLLVVRYSQPRVSC